MTRSAGDREEARKADAEACARQAMDVVPQAMRLLRHEMRKEAGQGLSVPQLRVLAFLSRAPGASVSAVADFAGVAAATASAMIDRLVRRELVVREADPKERRRVTLELTADGSALLERARAHACARVAGRLTSLSDSELATLTQGFELLRRVLAPSAQPEPR